MFKIPTLFWGWVLSKLNKPIENAALDELFLYGKGLNFQDKKDMN